LGEKGMTAQEFEVVFYEAMHKWVAGGKVGPDPRGEWEAHVSGRWQPPSSPCVPSPLSFEYRWKPSKKRTVIIDGVELVAPEVGEPKEKAEYFYERTDGGIDTEYWDNHDFDKKILTIGKMFLTRKDCQAMADFQRNQRLGGAA
jgi:hypothetical protein